MRRCYLFNSLAFTVLLVVASAVHAGGPGGGSGKFCKDGPDRNHVCENDADCPDSQCITAPTALVPAELFRSHVCKGGPNKNSQCERNADCPNSTCVLDIVKGPGTTFMADLTIIPDDNVSTATGDEGVSNVKAVTILLEFTKNKQRHLLAQTYQGLQGTTYAALVSALQTAPLPIVGTETLMKDAVENQLILNYLLATIQGDSHLLDAIRAISGVSGFPTIVEVPKTITKSVTYYDRQADALASVFRLKVKIGFLPF